MPTQFNNIRYNISNVFKDPCSLWIKERFFFQNSILLLGIEEDYSSHWDVQKDSERDFARKNKLWNPFGFRSSCEEHQNGLRGHVSGRKISCAATGKLEIMKCFFRVKLLKNPLYLPCWDLVGQFQGLVIFCDFVCLFVTTFVCMSVSL